MSTLQRMSIAEFRAQGWLQEINRRLLHPAGLALEIVIDDDGTERLGGVWDYRDDPEGIYFDDLTAADVARAAAIDATIAARAPAREAALGYVVQPLAA
jgi:hypothetical protein